MEIGNIAGCANGLYVIISKADGTYSAIGRNGNILKFTEADKLTEIPQDFVDYTIREGFKGSFTGSTRSKGIDYHRWKKVRTISCTQVKNKIDLIAKVQGTHQYTVTITIDRGDLISGCTCPVGYRCKHQAAVFFELQAYFNDLNEQGARIQYQSELVEINVPFENTAELKKAITVLSKSRGNIYSACRAVTDAAQGTVSGIRTALQLASKNSSCTKKSVNELVNAFVLRDDANLKLRMVLSVDPELKNDLYTAYNTAVKNREEIYANFSWRESVVGNKALYNYYNHQWRGLLDVLTKDPVSNQLSEYLVQAVLEDAKAESDESLELACFRICSGTQLGFSRTFAIQAASVLPHPEYLTAYLENCLTLKTPEERQRYMLANFDNDLTLNRSVTPEGPEQTNITALYAHFQPQWEVNEYNNTACLSCSLVPKVLPQAQLIPMKFTENPDGSIKILENRIDSQKFNLIAKAVLTDIKSRDGEQIDLQLNKLNNEIEAREKAKKLEQIGHSMDSLMRNLSASEVILEEDSSVDVQFFINSQSDTSTTRQWKISLQVGNARMYTVRDVVTFLDYFKTGATHVYGKQLTLTHLYENIRPDKRDALKILQLCMNSLPGYTSAYLFKREPVITDESLAALLNVLKGSSITIDGTDYRIRLDNIACRVSLDASGILGSSLNRDNGKLLKLGTELFLLDNNDNVIDHVEGTQAQQQLYLFATENDGIDIMPVLDRFNDQIYSRFYSDIDIAEPMRGKLHLSELEIDAYFDYTDNSVTVRTSMTRDGIAITADDLTLPVDKGRYNAYTRYLEKMGFKDGVVKNDSSVLAFFTMDMTPLKKYCNVFLSDAILNKKIEKFARPMIRIQRSGGIMQAFLENSEYSDDELKKIYSAVRRRKKFILFKGDRVVDLTGSDAEDFQLAVEDIGLNQDHMTEPKQMSTPQALRAFAHERECRIDEYLYKMIDDIRNFKHSEIPVPELKAMLRPYQEEGFHWLRTLADYRVGGILADDMGLGKTLQFIALLKSDPEKGPDLVVCPKSLVFNWINEFRRFDPDTKAVEIYGTPAARKETIASIDPNERAVYITSYDSLRNDQEEYNLVFRYLVLDEAQYIKNVTAIKSRTVKQLKAQHRFALTGTPIENSILDLWSIFDFIMPGYFDDVSTFKSEYNRNEKFTAAVARRIAPFVLRRTKRDVLKDLPEKYERILTVEMKPEQRKLYDAFKREAAEKLASGAGAFDVLPYLMRLRQICDAPSLFVEGYQGGSGKLEALEELIETYLAEGHRILIFSQFVQALEQLSAMLRKKRIGFYTITGDTPAKQRIEQMSAFNDKDNINIFLISLKAGGTGLNLTGADTVIHLDPWWNVAAEDQASDRAHRIGQTRNVEVIRLICENSVEQRVIELQNMKKDIIDKLISNDDSSVTGVSLEDIAFILG